MKIIDLLNKIANGEEVPKILHKGKYGIYEKEKGAVAFYNDEKCTSYFGSWFNWSLCEDGLNDEIEIIEEKKIPEKLDFDISTFNYKEYGINIMRNNVIANTEAINQLIDYLNSKGE